MAGWVNGDNTDANVHNNSGEFTLDSISDICNCGNDCNDNGCHLEAKIESGTNFDGFSECGDIIKSIDVISCNGEALKLWFGDNNQGYRLNLGGSALFNVRNIDCESIIMVNDGFTSDSCNTLSAVSYHTINEEIPNGFISGNTDLTKVHFPSAYNGNDGVNTKTIGDGAFDGCSNLSEIEWGCGGGSEVTTIGQSAFNGCTSLTSVTIPNSVRSIYNNAFQNCTSLSSITINENIHSISMNVFNGCTSLSSITIPSSVTTIGANAFANCSSLSSITMNHGSSPPSTDTSSFSGVFSTGKINGNLSSTSVWEDWRDTYLNGWKLPWDEIL